MAAYIAFYVSHIMLALTRRANYAAVLLFVVLNVWFVGLRYEIGFDWVIYKDQFGYFSQLSLGDFLSHFGYFQQHFQHEPGFLILAYLSSHVLPTYEFFHLAVFLVFFLSVLFLGRAMGCRNLIAAFLVIHLFLLFTLEFSTVRQNLAIAIFNVGLAFSFRNRKVSAYVVMLTAVLFQLSALIYLAMYLAASGSRLRVWLYMFPLMLLAAFASLIGLSQLPFINTLGHLGAKLIWYFDLREVTPNVFEQVFFLALYFIVATWAFVNSKNNPLLSKGNKVIIRMIFVMALSALIFFGVTIIRNRIMYEMIILVSLAAFMPQARMKSSLRPVLFCWGAIFLMASLVKPASFMYVPYQNYVASEIFNLQSDGPQRQERLTKLIASQ